jgi:hypothetical protein
MLTNSHFTIKRNLWSVFERKFQVFGPGGELVMFVMHPLMKLREQFTVSEDEQQERPIFTIKSRQIVAVNHTFDIVDARSGQLVGTVQKQGFKSMFRDRFQIFDGSNREIGYMEEQGASVLRRFIPLLTSKHAIFIEDERVAWIEQRFRFFNKEFDVSIESQRVDQRFVLACALLALIAEARREDRR